MNRALPVSRLWRTKSKGAVKIKANSTGSVIPVIIEVSAAVSIIPAVFLRFSYGILDHGQGRCRDGKDMMTKIPGNAPAVGSPA